MIVQNSEVNKDMYCTKRISFYNYWFFFLFFVVYR